MTFENFYGFTVGVSGIHTVPALSVSPRVLMLVLMTVLPVAVWISGRGDRDAGDDQTHS